jgi:hypothetical protein
LAEIEQGKGNISSSGVLAKQFLTRFDRANPSHPAVMLASEILSEAGLTYVHDKKKGDQVVALTR